MRARLRLSLLFGLLCVLAAPCAAQTLVVFTVDTPRPADSAAWTAALRAQVQTRPDLTLLHPDQIEALLPPDADGRPLTLAECEGDCALQTGRSLGVDLILTARMRHVDDWIATVALIRVEDGRLLAQRVVQRPRAAAALKQAAAATLDAWLDRVPRTVVRAEPIAQPGAPVLFVKSSTPTTIIVDGRPVGTTPFGLSVPDRYVRLIAKAPGHVTQRMLVDLGPMSGRLTLNMQPATGKLMVKWGADFRDVTVWIDDAPHDGPLPVRLPPGLHHVQVRSPCGDSRRMPVELSMGQQVEVSLPIQPRCPRLLLRAQPPQTAILDGVQYQATPDGTASHRVGVGRRAIRLPGRLLDTVSVNVPADAPDVMPVDLPGGPSRYGGDLGFQYRQNAGGLAVLRAWSHHRLAQRPRWGVHLGIGIKSDAVPDSDETRGFGGLFLGGRFGVPLASFLEFTGGLEVGLVATDSGAPLAATADVALRFRLPHIAVSAGWGLGLHPLVEDSQDMHGLRIAVMLTE